MALALPREVFLYVLRSCEQLDLLQLSLVSKDLHLLCLPLIYREVDLGTRGAGIPRWLDLDYFDFDSEIPGKRHKYIEWLQRAQGSFLRTLLKHPEYAFYVRSLSWTLTFGSEWCGENGEWCDDTTGYDIEHIMYPHDHTWQVFGLLTLVRYLDLGSEHYLMRHSYVRDVPRYLFPRATEVAFSGIMNQKTVHSIIAHDPGRLESLSVDNVQHWGHHADGMPMTSDHERLSLDSQGDPSLWCAPGPILGLFDTSTSFTSLKFLMLRKISAQNVIHRDIVPEVDIAVYKEWATLINAVKRHLTTLVIEQATDGPMAPGRVGHQTRRPMDQRFHDYLLPLFLEPGWDCLERLEIRGVGHWHNEEVPVMNEFTKQSIADAVGSHVSLLITEEHSRPAYMWSPPGY